jgi:hypothetical protein
MSKVKYRVREYNPTSAQQGSHSFFAEAVINNEITNAELAEKIADRTGVKAYEVTTAICSIGDENVTFTYADGRTETERFADIVEQARLYILTDCGGSFERFAEWGLVRPDRAE